MSEHTDPLNLTLGSVLQVQATVPENAPRHSVRLIGALPGASLVVTTPSVAGRVQIVREGQRFTVRALKGEWVMGFVSQVLFASMKPYPHLHLEYPDEIEQIVVRNASRVSADIPATVRHTDQPNDAGSFVDVTLVDLSETGAKIASGQRLGGADETLHIKFELMVSGAAEELGLLGDIKNATERVVSSHDDDASVHYTGVRFRTLSRFQQVLLHAWVTNHILQDALRSQGQ
ncbi:MAG: flagellar brake protein [Gammaproteobacteria bacterium]|nr:flagellar brake protein [Gammaproteobacteria bacterium]